MNDENIVLPFDDGPSSGPCKPKRKSGRRSWFAPGKPERFDIAVERPAPQYQDENDEVEVLELTHFSRQPKIDFGAPKPGKVVTRPLLVRNPHDYEQQVIVEKFPSKKSFSIDLVEFAVDAGDEMLLTITWEPKEPMRCREMVIFKVDGVYRLQTFLIGQVLEPPKSKKRRGSALRGRRTGPPSGLRPAATKREAFKECHSNVSIPENNHQQAPSSGVEKKRKPLQKAADQEDQRDEVRINSCEDENTQRWHGETITIDPSTPRSCNRQFSTERLEKEENTKPVLGGSITVEPSVPYHVKKPIEHRRSPLEAFLFQDTFKAPSETFVVSQEAELTRVIETSVIEEDFRARVAGQYPIEVPAARIHPKVLSQLLDQNGTPSHITAPNPAVSHHNRRSFDRDSLDEGSISSCGDGPDGNNKVGNLEEIEEDYESVIQQHSALALSHNDPRLPETPTRRTTFIKAGTDDGCAVECGREGNFGEETDGIRHAIPSVTSLCENDPRIPDTPTRRTTFIKSHCHTLPKKKKVPTATLR